MANNSHLNLVSYFGGKYPHLDWLISHFPKGKYHFIDLMCGSANVALNVNYPLITVNDINDDIINLFFVLREFTDEFLMKLALTPYSRKELYNYLENAIPTDPVERARQYFLRCQLSYGTNGSQNKHKGINFEKKLNNCHPKVKSWTKKLKKILPIAEKLRSFQIESRNALEYIDQLDFSSNIIYIDPPYSLKTRASKKRYKYEVDEDFHIQLLDKVSQIQYAKVIVSGYEDPEDQLYDNYLGGFYKSKKKPTRSTIRNRKRQEILWMNYNPEKLNKQISFFPKTQKIEN